MRRSVGTENLTNPQTVKVKKAMTWGAQKDVETGSNWSEYTQSTGSTDQLHLAGKAGQDSAFTYKRLECKKKIELSDDSLVLSHIWWIPILQALEGNHSFIHMDGVR